MFDTLTPKPTEKKEKKKGTLDIKVSGVRPRNIPGLVADSGQWEIQRDINFANKNLKNVSAIKFTAHGTGINPAVQEVLLEDNATNQRLKIQFANFAGTVYQFDLTDTCQPAKEVDPKYEEKYELMEELDDSRFKIKYPTESDDIPEQYLGEPVAHYPSMGNDGTEMKQHHEAMRKRPWLPMKKLPDELPTMGQYPYPPVESPLIGSTESKMNLYQLIAHSYNQLQKRCAELEKRVEKLEKGIVI
jgi:hypothetical protein